MLPTFVIGLREGLEAALIVGIVAAFLRQRGRVDLLRLAFIGVGAAAALCLAIGIALDVVSHDLPQRQQEGLETVIGAAAVLMVTYMVVWMKRHSRTLKAQLEGAADSALAAGSGFALVAMAFLAVLREGLETVVFLLAAFNQAGNTGLAATGAVLGIVVAIILGWGIYRGGVKINLSKFFRLTGLVLTFVAAGLVVSALHTAHEAGWLTAGQQQTVDLSALVSPGSVQAALLTGMLGVQSHPVVIEVIGWLVYLIPVGLYVAWPPGRRLSNLAIRRALLAGGALALVGAVVLTVLMPSRPAHFAVTRTADGVTAQLVSSTGSNAVIAATVVHPGSTPAAVQQLTATRDGTQISHGVTVATYRSTVAGAGASGTLTFAEIAQRNGGRLPLGVRAGDGTETAPTQTTTADVGTFLLEPRTGRIVDVQWRQTTTLTAQLSIGATVLGTPAVATWQLPEATATSAAAAAQNGADTLDRRSLLATWSVIAWTLVGLCVVVAVALALADRRRRPPAQVESATPRSALVQS